MLDTSTYLGLDRIDPAALPAVPELTAVTLVELHQGVAMAQDPRTRAARIELLGAAIVEFEPLPFDGPAAGRYGTLVGLIVAAGRSPRPRRMDLMIAAIASVRGLPLYTGDVDDFRHLDDLLTLVEVVPRR